MDKECKSYIKVCYKEPEQICKSFYHIVLLEICKSFQLMPKGSDAKKKYFVGETSKDFEKKWDGNLRDIESKCRNLLLEEHCKKLLYLMNCFWKTIPDVDADINWLVEVRNHLDKNEKEHAKANLHLNFPFYPKA